MLIANDKVVRKKKKKLFPSFVRCRFIAANNNNDSHTTHGCYLNGESSGGTLHFGPKWILTISIRVAGKTARIVECTRDKLCDRIECTSRHEERAEKRKRKNENDLWLVKKRHGVDTATIGDKMCTGTLCSCDVCVQPFIESSVSSNAVCTGVRWDTVGALRGFVDWKS